jgi:hypothetical protein
MNNQKTLEKQNKTKIKVQKKKNSNKITKWTMKNQFNQLNLKRNSQNYK